MSTAFTPVMAAQVLTGARTIDEGILFRVAREQLNKVPAYIAGAKANSEGFEAFVKLLERPADAKALAGLAARYHSDALGELNITQKDGKAWMDVGTFSSEITTMPQPDGTVAFVTIDPVALGFLFVRANQDGVRQLITRDGQHEYVFNEVK